MSIPVAIVIGAKAIMGMGVDMDKISTVEAIVGSPLGAVEVPVKAMMQLYNYATETCSNM